MDRSLTLRAIRRDAALACSAGEDKGAFAHAFAEPIDRSYALIAYGYFEAHPEEIEAALMGE